MIGLEKIVNSIRSLLPNENIIYIFDEDKENVRLKNN